VNAGPVDGVGSRRLTLTDIADVRAYERERDGFRRHVIALKARRRVAVGELISLVFENRDTIRFQVQEMARAERIATDEGIQTELDVYNPLIPGPGELCATLFVELTTEAALREWLPKLVGIQRAVTLRTAAGHVLAPEPEPDHERNLTRSHTTSCVHYLHWTFGPAEVEAAAAGLTLAVDHPAYRAATVLSPETLAELRSDLAG
jgi:hypothetical protein